MFIFSLCSRVLNVNIWCHTIKSVVLIGCVNILQTDDWVWIVWVLASWLVSSCRAYVLQVRDAPEEQDAGVWTQQGETLVHEGFTLISTFSPNSRANRQFYGEPTQRENILLSPYVHSSIDLPRTLVHVRPPFVCVCYICSVCDHITPRLRQVYWLPVRSRV